jgi:toluene monooxygenase system protein E
MSARRTYWHLQSLGRRPSDYDIATSRLLYHPQRGFEIAGPGADWYARHQQGSPLQARDWERFSDPRETTYSRYVELQRTKEAFVESLLEWGQATGYDQRLSPAWVRSLESILPVLRYPLHGLQMLAAYLGQLAPASRIVIVCLLQAGDEIRRVQRCAYRMRELQAVHPGFGEGSKATWQDDPRWQPLRACIERLLVTYDWGEAFVALCLVLKPMFDAMFTVHLARLAEHAGDELLGKLSYSLAEDCRWHHDWSAALVRMLCEDEPGNHAVIEAWIDRWRPQVGEAVAALAPLFDGPDPEGGGEGGRAVLQAVQAAAVSQWRAAGLQGGTGA